METITVGVLTVSDRCANHEAVDESGPNLVKMLENGIIPNAKVAKTSLVPDNKTQIEDKLKEWCDVERIDVILTTGGTGIGIRDVTPEATASVLDKPIPGISMLMFKHSSEKTVHAALSRALAGVRKESLIVNFPGSRKASEECLECVSKVIPHAVDLIRDKKKNIEKTHSASGKKSKVDSSNVAGRSRVSEYECLSVQEGQKMIIESVSMLTRIENVDYENALGFVLAEDVFARDCLPPFDASLKDGYAVASKDESLEKLVIGASNAGAPSEAVTHLPDGCCFRINTGGIIPKGADAVVQVEDTEVVDVSGKKETSIRILKRPKAGLDIRPKGSDYNKGDLLLERDTYLGCSALGVLAASGNTTVKVFLKPTVGVLSTGDELVEPRDKLEPGKVRDSNRVTVISLLKEEGFPVLDLGIVKDEVDSLLNSLERGFEKADVVVTTGSMSMGDKDYLKQILIKDFGAKLGFGRLFMKPGKPTSFSVLNVNGKWKLWVGLPGNPASSFVTSQLILLPALRKMSGRTNLFPLRVKAKLMNAVKCEDRPHYQRAVLSYKECDGYSASTTGSQSSSRIGSCVNATCLLEIPTFHSAVMLPKGSVVDALIIGKQYS